MTNRAQFDIEIRANTAALQGVESALRSLEGTSRSAFGGVQASANSAFSVFTGFSAANIAGKIAGDFISIGQASLTAAGNVEQMRVRFTNLLGSQQAANAEIATLQQLANNSAFSMPQLVQAETRLIGVGKSAGEAREILHAVGDTVAGVGGGTAEIEGVTLALAQMASKGKVSSEELNQISERGIPGLQILARALNTTTAETQALVEAGSISADVFIQAFNANAVERFGGAMQAQAQTWNGLLSTADDLKTTLLATFGSGIIEAAEPGLNSLLTELQDPATVANIRQMGVEFGQFVTQLSAGISEAARFLGIIGQAPAAVAPAQTAAQSAYSTALAALGKQTEGIQLQQSASSRSAAALRDNSRAIEDTRKHWDALIDGARQHGQELDRNYERQKRARDLARAEGQVGADLRLAGDIFSGAGQAARARLQDDRDRVTDLKAAESHAAAKEANQDTIRGLEQQKAKALDALQAQKRGIQDASTAQAHHNGLISTAVDRARTLAKQYVDLAIAIGKVNDALNTANATAADGELYGWVANAALAGMPNLGGPKPGVPGPQGQVGGVSFGWSTADTGTQGVLGPPLTKAANDANANLTGAVNRFGEQTFGGLPIIGPAFRTNGTPTPQTGGGSPQINTTVNVQGSASASDARAIAAAAEKAVTDAARKFIGSGRR